MTRAHAIIIAVGLVFGMVVTCPFGVAVIGGPPRTTATVTTSSPAVTYESYLLLWLDDYQQPHPVVEAVWIAQAPSNGSAIELIGLPPEPFRDQFSPALSGVPLLSIQPYLRGQLAGNLILDRSDLKELTDRLGGVYHMGQETNGEALLSYILSADPSRPDDLLIRQGAAMQSLLAQFAAQYVTLDFGNLLETPSLYTVETSKLRGLIQRYQPFTTESVRIRLALAASPLAP